MAPTRVLQLVLLEEPFKALSRSLEQKVFLSQRVHIRTPFGKLETLETLQYPNTQVKKRALSLSVYILSLSLSLLTQADLSHVHSAM